MGNSPAKIETVSRAISENVQRSLTSTIVSLVASSNATLSANQLIDISGVTCKGDFNMNNVSQKSVIKYNLTRLNTSSAYQAIQSSIANGIENALESDTSVKKGALSLASDMGVTTETDAKSLTINEITSSYTFNNYTNDVTSINSAQTISVKNIISQTGDCNLNNISQSIVLDALAKQIAESVAKNATDILSKSKLYQTTSSKTSYEQSGVLQDFFNGLSNVFGSISGFLWIIIIIVFVALFGMGYLVYSLLSSDDSTAGMPPAELSVKEEL